YLADKSDYEQSRRFAQPSAGRGSSSIERRRRNDRCRNRKTGPQIGRKIRKPSFNSKACLRNQSSCFARSRRAGKAQSKSKRVMKRTSNPLPHCARSLGAAVLAFTVATLGIVD